VPLDRCTMVGFTVVVERRRRHPPSSASSTRRWSRVGERGRPGCGVTRGTRRYGWFGQRGRQRRARPHRSSSPASAVDDGRVPLVSTGSPSPVWLLGHHGPVQAGLRACCSFSFYSFSAKCNFVLILVKIISGVRKVQMR
jgi:hypothetical protein